MAGEYPWQRKLRKNTGLIKSHETLGLNVRCSTNAFFAKLLIVGESLRSKLLHNLQHVFIQSSAKFNFCWRYHPAVFLRVSLPQSRTKKRSNINKNELFYELLLKFQNRHKFLQFLKRRFFNIFCAMQFYNL